MNYRATLFLIALLGFVVVIQAQTKLALLQQQLNGRRCGAQIRFINAYWPNNTEALNVRVKYGLGITAGKGEAVGQRNIGYGHASHYLNVPGGLIRVYVSHRNRTTLSKVQLYVQDGGMYTLALTPFNPTVNTLASVDVTNKVLRSKAGIPVPGIPYFALFEEDPTPPPVGYFFARFYQLSLYSDFSIDFTASAGTSKAFASTVLQGDVAVTGPLAGISNDQVKGTTVTFTFQVHGTTTSVLPSTKVQNGGFSGFYYDVILVGNTIPKTGRVPNTLSTSFAQYLPTKDRYGCERFGPTTASAQLFPITLLEFINTFN